MPPMILRRIVAASAARKPFALRLRCDNGDENQVDVSGLVETFRVYEPLRASPDLFRKIRVGDLGTDVVWTDEIDMSADTLWRLAQEQEGVERAKRAKG